MKTIVAGNWKMHTDVVGAEALMDAIAAWSLAHPGHVSMIVAPPFPFLAMAVMKAAQSGGIIIAAQNCHQEEQGAFTGEVSASMLKSIGVKACIVGHSERREYYGETDDVVGRKIKVLLAHGLRPIYCCGERQQEREAGQHKAVVAAQLRAAMVHVSQEEVGKVIIAYEPVWAIGTGLTATPEQAQEMHAFIRAELSLLFGSRAMDMPILYGGSCKPANAAGIFACGDINGGLIGGASVVAESFIELACIAGDAKSHH